jgi:hypothetical protein
MTVRTKQGLTLFRFKWNLAPAEESPTVVEGQGIYRVP